MRFLRPHFHRQRLATLCDLMVATMDEVMNRWAENAMLALDVYHAFSKVTLAVLTRTMFGLALSDAEFAWLQEAF